MSAVALLVICHDTVGTSIVESAQNTLACCPLPVQVLCASGNCDPEALLESALNAIDTLDQGAGVLVLTDLFGSTPSNIAVRLLAREGVRVVTGLNLPMLIRVFNYCRLPLEELAAKAVSGGRDGVFDVDSMI